MEQETIGTIIWYSPEKRHGIIEAKDGGIVQKYFLLKSQIAQSPEIIKVGQYARFYKFTPPKKPGLLPLALTVEVSDTPFVDAGANTLKAGE